VDTQKKKKARVMGAGGQGQNALLEEGTELSTAAWGLRSCGCLSGLGGGELLL
jgi:hypothetical protein